MLTLKRHNHRRQRGNIASPLRGVAGALQTPQTHSIGWRDGCVFSATGMTAGRPTKW